jgi:glycolate oxidase FAD binding subunit
VSERELESIVGRDGMLAFASPWLPSDVPLARPSDESALSELLRYAARDGKKVLPIGFGSKLGWTTPVERPDFALTTRALSGVIAYEPGDGTITARAGTTMAELTAVARAGGNHLTPDVPSPRASTIGGVLAAGQSGLDRERFGPSRHHVLGARAVLGDGTIARSGGRLVKNVTGYDMHRLYCGSHGSLAVLVEVSLRLFPGANSTASMSCTTANRADARRRARAVQSIGARPYAILAENMRAPDGRWSVHVLLSGREEVVEWEAREVQSAMAAVEVEREERAHEHFDELRGLVLPTQPSLHIGVPPSKLDAALDHVEYAARAARADVRFVFEPTLATIDVVPSTKDAPAAAWIELVRALRSTDLDVRARNVSLDVRRALDRGEAPSGADWMRRLKAALDPLGVLAPGVPGP